MPPERLTSSPLDRQVERETEVAYHRAPSRAIVVGPACRLPAGGAFPASDDIDDCRFCNYRSACQAVKTDLGALCEASERKIDNPLNTVLKPFVELRRDP